VYLWSKSENFVRFIEAPKMGGETFEIATDVAEALLAERFRKCGWRLKNPHTLSSDRECYRAYIQGSYGEFTVAKDQYNKLNTGWFSDRSACYLAAGRPVITQETGFTRFYGGESGLFAFSNVDEICQAVRAIRADYATHSRAAFEISQECFEAGKVLCSMLDRAGV
jgi:hypothetical protein